jgi:PAS domain S-box-containing protein
VGLLPTIGYLYGVQWLYGLARVSAIAWPTAISIVALGIGVLCARPSESVLAQVLGQDAGGTMVRRLLIPVLALPVALGWLQVTGQRSGWFDPAMGTALLTLTFMVSLSTLAWRAGRRGSLAAAELGVQKELLAVSQEKFAKAFRGNTSAMAITRLRDGTFIDVNDRYLETTGLSRQDVVGKSSHQLRVWKHPAERDGFVRRLSERGEVHSTEYAFVRTDGSEWTGLVSSQMSELEGEPIVISSIVDITGRKRAEDALRDSETRLKAALASMTDAVFISDADGRFVEFNQAFATFHRFPGRDACARTLAEYPRILEVLMADGTPAPLDQWAVARALRGETATNAEYILRRRDTGETWVGSYSFAPIRDGRGAIVGSVVVGRDVTDHRLQERRVEELSRLYAVLSKVNEAIVRTGDPLVLYRDVCHIVAEDGQRPLVWIGLVEGRRVNPVAASGRASDYLRGVTVETDGELGHGPTGTCIREGRPVVNDDFDVNPATRPWRAAALAHDLRASAAFPLRHQGAVVGALTLYGSVAGTFDQEQVRLLEALSADISYALDKMGQEQALKESERSLREADRRKDDFLAMLSHELRNPLAPIRSGIYILDRATPGGEQARRAQAVIDRQVTHLTRLVDDLLDVTRISRGKIRLQREPIDLAELVRRVVEDHRSAFVANNLDLGAAIPLDPIRVDADWTRVAQVMGNLLHNASKFTPAGGRVTVSVEADREIGQAVARVRDTGTGIEPEMLPRIFEPFTQAATTMDRSRGGLGLGLALVKGLVDLHQGQVAAYSDGLGKGSEFVVRLPLVDTAAIAPQPAQPLPSRARRVLVIEDNLDAADCLQTLLEFGGHVVRVAGNGRDGLSAAREFMPEVVLCDIGLPGMDGFEVARAFRADPALRGVALVALSGYALQEDVQRALQAGFDRHLAKPANPETVERVLAELAPTPGS